MFDHFKRFFKHSLIYTTGNVINRGAAFLLIPLYTHLLSAKEYGILEMFYSTSAVISALLSMGVAHATLRFYYEYKDDAAKKEVISTSFIIFFIFCTLILLPLISFSKQFSLVLFKTTQYRDFFRVVLVTLLFTLSNEVALAFIRAKEYSHFFIFSSFAQLLLQVALNIYMMVVLKMGVYGILLGNLITVFIVWIIMTIATIRYSGIHIDISKLKSMFKYSYPFILATMAGIVINTADRFFLNEFSTLSIVGLYALALRFGMIIKIVLIDPFSTNFGAFRFSIMNEVNAKEIYSKIATYFLFVAVFLSLALSVFAKDILKIISSSQFQNAYKIVPIITAAIVLGGMNYVFQTGIYINKKTKYIFFVTTLSAILTIILNRYLIPRFNMYGAALATVFCSIFTCAYTYYFSQKLYRIRYEFIRYYKMVLVAITIYALTFFLNSGNAAADIIFKLSLVLSFPLMLWLIRFYKKEELSNLAELKNSIFAWNLRMYSFFQKALEIKA